MKKCPRCGSRDVASYLYGMPVWSEVLEDEIKCGRIIPGGCCVSDYDPRYRCKACHRKFGYPPVKKHKNGSRNYLEQTIKIFCSVGGYFGGYSCIEISSGSKGTINAIQQLQENKTCKDERFFKQLWRTMLIDMRYGRNVLPSVKALIKSEPCEDAEFLTELQRIIHDNSHTKSKFLVRISHAINNVLIEYPIKSKQYASLLNRLYNWIHLLEWKRRYANNDICDGTQWKIKITCDDGSHLDFYGSNEYPPYYKEMLSVFRPFFKKAGIAFEE